MQPLDYSSLEANYSPRQDLVKSMQSQQTKKPWWTSIISELGGGGGAAAGAAAGTAIAPGVGTILGAILGGFTGGTGGRVIENKVRDNRIGIGDALKEGVFSGGLAGLGEGYSALKGAKAVASLGDVAKGTEGAVQAAPKVGLIEGMGRNVKAGASGYGIGSKVAGEQPLTAVASDRVGQTLKNLKIPASAPETQARALGTHVGNLSNILTTQYARNVAPVDTKVLGQSILKGVGDIPLLSVEAKTAAGDLVKNDLSRVKNTNDLWSFLKNIDSKINFGKNPEAALADRQAIAQVIRQEGRGTLNALVPGVANTNNVYHDAVTAQKYLLNAAKDRSGSGLIGTVKNLAPVKGAEAKAGNLLENVGKLSAGTATGPVSGPASDLLRQMKIQAPASLARGVSGNQNPQQSDLLAGTNQSTGAINPNTMLSSGGMNGTPQTGKSSFASPQGMQQAMMQDFVQTGGKNFAALQALAQAFGGGTQKLSAPQQARKDSISSALGSLDSAASNLTAAGGAQGLQGELGKLPWLGKFIDPQAAAYTNTKVELATALAKAITGGSRAPQNVIDYYMHSLPDINDTPEYAQAKISKLQNDLYAQANRFGYNDLLPGNTSGSGTNLLQLTNGQ